MTEEGTVRERRRRKARQLWQRGLPDAARLVTVAYQGGTKKALVEFSPLRWDGETGELWLARRLRVHLRLKTAAARDRVGRASRRSVVAHLATTFPGLHGVSFEEMFGGRRRMWNARRLRLSRQGETVAFHVEPNRDRFGPGSTLYFVSAGDAVYELEYGVKGERMALERAAPHGEPTAFYWRRLEREEDRLYQAALLDAEDLWLWDIVMASETKRYSFALSALADVGEAARLSMRLQGGSDLPTDPDHHVRVLVNGVVAGEASWNAKRSEVLELALPLGVLRRGQRARTRERWRHGGGVLDGVSGRLHGRISTASGGGRRTPRRPMERVGRGGGRCQ